MHVPSPPRAPSPLGSPVVELVVGREDNVVLEADVLEAAGPVEEDVVPIARRHDEDNAVVFGPRPHL